MGLVNPWHPMNNPIDIKHLGKLLEELGELQAAVARCLIQGINEKEPMTGKLNRNWLAEEIADVQASLYLVELRFNVYPDTNRIQRKVDDLRNWYELA